MDVREPRPASGIADRAFRALGGILGGRKDVAVLRNPAFDAIRENVKSSFPGHPGTAVNVFADTLKVSQLAFVNQGEAYRIEFAMDLTTGVVTVPDPTFVRITEGDAPDVPVPADEAPSGVTLVAKGMRSVLDNLDLQPKGPGSVKDVDFRPTASLEGVELRPSGSFENVDFRPVATFKDVGFKPTGTLAARSLDVATLLSGLKDLVNAASEGDVDPDRLASALETVRAFDPDFEPDSSAPAMAR